MVFSPLCSQWFKRFSDFDVEWMEECILVGVVLFDTPNHSKLILELHDLTEVMSVRHCVLSFTALSHSFTIFSTRTWLKLSVPTFSLIQSRATTTSLTNTSMMSFMVPLSFKYTLAKSTDVGLI